MERLAKLERKQKKTCTQMNTCVQGIFAEFNPLGDRLTRLEDRLGDRLTRLEDRLTFAQEHLHLDLAQFNVRIDAGNTRMNQIDARMNGLDGVIDRTANDTGKNH